jgi:DNA replication protein DnaD
MAFISVADELAKKSFTSVENKFITKYLPVLEPNAVKVYLYALYLYQSGLASFTLTDLAQTLGMTEDVLIGYFEYLDEIELIQITSRSPFEVIIADCENVYGSPKKYKPEKYADFTKSVQNIIKSRMISPNEFREYFYLIEEYGFEPNALLMVITYCVNLKGEDIRLAYIKKVAKSFADEGANTAKKVEEKLSAYTATTPALLNLFTAIGINRRPDVDDEKYYKKWADEMGFADQAIVACAKYFKVKTMEKLDAALQELFKNRKFDTKEIEEYCKNKNSVYALTLQLAKSLGVYLQNPAPYVETYVSVWLDRGFEPNALQTVANYCFTHGNNSFEGMNDFVHKLYSEGIVTETDVQHYLEAQNAQDALLKSILAECGYTRKIIDFDRQCLENWQKWGFGDEMMQEAAKRSAGAKNPISYMNAILASWKQEGIFSPDKIPVMEPKQTPAVKKQPATPTIDKATIERHYSELRRTAEERADKVERTAYADATYAELRKKINSLSIQLAFAEIKDRDLAQKISVEMTALEKQSDERLKKLGIDKEQLTPQYSCKICGDTGYDKNGKQCECLKRFLHDKLNGVN